MAWSNGSLVSFLIALSFAAGLNLYATVGLLGLMARLGWAPLPPGLEVLGHGWVIGAALGLFALEFVADKIPAFDLVWNAVHTFVRVPAAALLAYQASHQLSPEMQMLVTAMGAAVAGVTHSSKTAVRVAANASPEPVSNALLSTGEDAAALGVTYLASKHPVEAGVLAAALTAGLGLAAWWCLRLVRKGWRRLRERWGRRGGEVGLRVR